MATFLNLGIPVTSSDELRSSITSEQCEPCLADCKEVNATVYCLDCDEKFCDACGNCHKKFKSSKDHKLCNVREAPPAHVVQLMKELITCPNHQSEEVVYICVDEDLPCCNQCANTKHRQCRQLETIEQCLKDGIVNKSSCTLEQKLQKQHLQNATARHLGHYYGYEVKDGFNGSMVLSKTQSKMVQAEKCEDINPFSKRICERYIDLHKQLKNITQHEVNQEMLVSCTPERVQEYLQVVHAKLASAFNTLQTNLMSQCRTQTDDLLTIIRRQRASAVDLQKQIKSNQEKMTSIQKHGQEKHVFLLSRRMKTDLNGIESSTRALENNKTLSTLNIVEKCSVNEIINNIVKALLIQKDKTKR
ncbi:hypothetical protein DPMN_058288 [Dreissena polymorpha]|uniref:B box-type domain-containing protein n=1 Tax=Dreissena polymorpha TaxID=45954 RepID=A0A9D4HDF8_DREPO|nr:hypothetical protein DPMN_058288 [Dreissena polymorpha]